MDQNDIDLLRTAPPAHLQAVVKMRRVPLSALSFNGSIVTATSASLPSSLLQEIARHLFDASALRTILSELSELEVSLLGELVSCGGRANSRDLALYCSSAGLVSAEKKDNAETGELLDGVESQQGAIVPSPHYPTVHPHGVFEQAVRHLLVLGLVFWGRQTNFSGREYTSGMHDGVLIVPQTLRPLIVQLWHLDKDPLVELTELARSADNIQELHALQGVQELQRTLYLYWSLVASLRDGLPIISNGLLSRAALRQVLEQVGGGETSEQIRLESDAPHLLFTRLLLMNLGLLEEKRNAIIAQPAESYFSLPLFERARLCYQTFLERPFWNELLYLSEVNVRPGPAPLEPAHEEVVRARKQVMARLFYEPHSLWRTFSAFTARTRLHIPYLLFPRNYGSRAERYSSGSNPYGWDFRLRRGWLTHREGWHMVEGGFIRALLAGPLSWLGLVELDRVGGASSFKLHPEALAVMSNISLAQPELRQGRVIVQPNFEVVVLSPVVEAILVALDRFAERVSLEHIAQYRISKASVTRAIQLGLHAEQMLEVLTRFSTSDIPQNVRYSIMEWERQARRIEIWSRATILEVEDSALLDELFADSRACQLFVRRISPSMAEVANQHLEALQELLWQRDCLPALTTAPENGSEQGSFPSTFEPQWHLHADGLLQPIYAVLNLYLVHEAESFSETDNSTGWPRLTANSVQRALEQGLTLDYLLQFLQHYCDGGIPGSLRIQLKLWGGGYTSHELIIVERTPLLRLPADLLADVQADADIAPLLGMEVEQQQRLVRVDEQHLDRVLSFLRQRGFSIDE